MNVLTWLKAEWTDHGTKILGALTAAVAGIILIPELATISVKALLILKIANVLLGVWTINRGFVNSAALKSVAEAAQAK